jgi:uncharacterized protein DUF3303
MLHMIVNTHNAESCAFRGEEEEKILVPAFERLAEAKGTTLEGWWVNRSGHEVFLLVDAANSHVIEDVLMEVGLVGRTHSRIVPVVPVEKAMEGD